MAPDAIRLSAAALYAFLQTPQAAGAEYPMLVNGTSMQPTLRHLRDTVWLAQLQRPPRPGDIVLFRRKSGQVVLHRVLRVRGQLLRINGDGQTFVEEVQRCTVVAVVTHLRRKGRDISCRAPLYRLYVRMWCALRPLRPLLFRMHGMCKRLWKRGTPCGKS